MRPIGIRKIPSEEYLRHYGGMIYLYRKKYYREDDEDHWYNLSTLLNCDPEDIIQLKRKV